MNDITHTNIVNEADAWSNYLNEIIGVLCLTLGMAVVSSPTPWLYGTICIIFVTALIASNYHRTPIADKLRRKRKGELSEIEQLALKDFYTRLKAKRFVSAIGYGFLSIATTGEVLFADYPNMLILIYG